MNLTTLHQESGALWNKNDGNNTHALNYDLNENSTVIDLGGYHGIWANQIIRKYNPYLIITEPIPEFYDFLKNKFNNNSKVTILNYGISTSNYDGELFFNDDGTSKFIKTSKTIKVKFITIQNLLSKINKTYIDLIQINIEGEEFSLLEKMLEDNTILMFKNIQIQYHTFIDNAFERRTKIQEKMLKFFNKNYDYPFIFEGWSLK
jgi:FkbM family methyltransferase